MYKLEVIEDRYKDFLIAIKEHFKKSKNSIHKARNELKIIDEKVVKSFKKPSLLKSIIYSLTPSKAKRSFYYSLKLKEFAPTPIGYIEFYKSGLLQESFFVAKKFDYDFTIREVLLDCDFKDREIILREFARFTFKLHESNVLHLDYSPGNILIKKEQGGFSFKVVDLNRMKFKELSVNERLKNFNKLWASDEDIDTIISEYANLVGIEKKDAVKLAQRYNQKNKNIKNLKKRIKGIPVVD